MQKKYRHRQLKPQQWFHSLQGLLLSLHVISHPSPANTICGPSQREGEERRKFQPLPLKSKTAQLPDTLSTEVVSFTSKPKFGQMAILSYKDNWSVSFSLASMGPARGKRKKRHDRRAGQPSHIFISCGFPTASLLSITE